MIRYFQSHMVSIRSLFRVAIVLTICLSSSLDAYAAEPDLVQGTKKYIECSKPILTEHEPHTSQGRGGFGVVVQGEPYYFNLAGRVLIAFDSTESAAPTAHMKVNRPQSADFEEQAAWRERMLQDVAERAGVALERSVPRPGMKLLTINKSSLTGKFAGQSLLIDQDRVVMVDWDWDIADRYRGPQDVKDLQAHIWKRLIPCLD